MRSSAGLVIIDSLNDAEEAEAIIVGGLRALGLDPADMRYLVLTHEHRDHIGGAACLQERYGLQVVASAPAWEAMARRPERMPRRQITANDGETWTVGDTAFRFTVTPGHTAGSLSIVFDVHDHGRRHVGALYGGFGIPRSAEDKMAQIDSLARFAEATRRLGVDALLANHQTHDLSLYNLDLLRNRRLRPGVAPGASNTATDFLDPHPYVISPEAYQRFLQVQSECVRVAAARSGQALPR